MTNQTIKVQGLDELREKLTEAPLPKVDAGLVRAVREALICEARYRP